MGISGELTLSGRLLPVSGIREKLLAAQRAGLRTVVFPEGNKADLMAMPDDAREGLEIVTLEEILDAVPHALLPQAQQPS